MLTKREQETLNNILATPPNNPVALHVLGQPLVDELCNIIRDQHNYKQESHNYVSALQEKNSSLRDEIEYLKDQLRGARM